METKTNTEKKSITTVNTKPSILKEKKKKIETKIATIVVHNWLI